MVKPNRPQIFIIGYYGFRNIGDEAILTCVLRELRRTIADPIFCVLSADPGYTRTLHSVEAVHPNDIPALVKAIQGSDLVILGGGGLLHDHWGYEPSNTFQPTRTGAAYFLGPTLLATQLNKLVMWYGLGIGPVQTASLQADILTCAQSASAITVRDVGSAPYAGQKAIVTADPAWGLSPGFTKTRRPLLGVVVRNWERGVDPLHWEKQLSIALQVFSQRYGLKILLIPFQTISGSVEDDRSISNRFAAQLPNASVLEGDHSPEEVIEILSGCQMIVAMRLHAVIFAAIAGLAVLPLAYDPKVSVLAAALGIERFCLSLSTSSPEIEAALEQLWAERISAGERLSIRAIEQRHLASRNAVIAADILGRDASPKESLLTGTVLTGALLRAYQYEQSAINLSTQLSTSQHQQDELRAALADMQIKAATIQDGLQQQIERLNAEQVRQVGELNDLLAQLETVSRHIEELEQSLKDQSDEAEFLRAELTGRDEAVASREAAAHLLKNELAQSKTSQQHLRGELDKIHGSRWWRLASLYWRWLDFWLALTQPIRAGWDQWTAAVKRLIPRKAKFEVVRLMREQQAKAEQSRLLASAPILDKNPAAVYQRQGLPEYVIQPALAAEQAATLESLAGKLPQVRLDVICFSIVDWEFRFQRPQQLMRQFARHGHRVFYLKNTWFLPPDAPERFRVREVEPNVFEVELSARRFPDIYGPAIEGLEKDHLLESLAELREAAQICLAVSMVQVPVWTGLALEARTRWGWKLAYDCMDDWGAFPGQNRLALHAEKRLVAACDVTFVSGQLLQKKWMEAGKQTGLVRNGVDVQFYAQYYQPNDRLNDLLHPIIGYYGAIADWFDIDLLVHLANERPRWQFVLLGGVFGVDVSALNACTNVHLLGNQPYETMPEYLWHFDVCIIPFKINALTDATDPVKFYEYLSSGKPVVAAAIQELEPYRDCVYLAHDHAEFLALLDRAIAENNDELSQHRRQVAQANTWLARYTQMWEAIAGLYPLVSVVVVTYGNLPLTALCLESLLARTGYPNLELIVVDNASPDATTGYLQELERRDLRVKLILNERNLGFAHANNQGLAIAAGQYFVLLNNDTIVPPDWLPPLLHHLEDPQVGLVGPVTNFAGNEAKLDVSYCTWTEMEQFASDVTWAKLEQSFDIPMLAFYCVALRREVWEKLGPLDEAFGVGMFEDDDYAHRARQAGYRVICAEDSFVHHFGQAAFKALIQAGSYDHLFEINRRRFESKWNTKWVPHRFRVETEWRNGNSHRTS